MPRLILAAALILTLGAGPATKPAEPKPLSKVEEVLAKLPKAARPEKGQWNEFNTPKANQWFGDNAGGLEVEGTFALKDVIASPVKPEGEPDKVVRWNIEIQLDRPTVHFEGTSGTVRIGPAGNGGWFPFPVDEKTARAAKGWKPGEKVVLRMKLKGVRVEPDGDDLYVVVAEAWKVIQVGATKVPDARSL